MLTCLVLEVILSAITVALLLYMVVNGRADKKQSLEAERQMLDLIKEFDDEEED